MARDITKFSFNGKDKLAKNRLVLEVIKQYVDSQQEVSYTELKKVFPDKLQGSIGVIKNEQDLIQWEKNKKDSNKRKNRFFTDEKDIIRLVNNEKIYVCTEWGAGEKENILSFINHVKNKLDYKISGTEQLNIQNEVIEKEIGTRMKTKNIILYGAPGVGKTHNYKRLINMIEEGSKKERTIFDTIQTNDNTKNEDFSFFDEVMNEERIEFVTFHQSYSYEDFIEGFRPKKNGDIELENGIFKTISQKAQKSDKNFYIMIDEINRGNISKIFGELITLIEESKRDDYSVTLPYSKLAFSIPSNLYIIATMNSSDKSIATIDIALRRRFTFLKMYPNTTLVTNDKAKIFMQKANQYIFRELNEDYQLGHSYFMGEDIDLEFIKEYKIKPLLEEYFYTEDKSVNTILDEIEKENINNEQ